MAQWAIPPRLWSSLCLARYPPSRLPPQGLGTGCSLCLEGSPQISTWPAHSSRLSLWDFPGGPVVKYLPCKARDVSLILAWGTKIPHAKLETPHSQINVFLKKQRTSLVAQCLEFACQCQGHGFHPWSRKIPHATKLTHHNYWACALELGNHNCWTRVP